MEIEVTVRARVNIPDNATFIEDYEGNIVAYEIREAIDRVTNLRIDNGPPQKYSFWLSVEKNEQDDLVTSSDMECNGIEIVNYHEHSIELQNGLRKIPF